MKKEEIHWLDWHRIFFGNTPELFLLEVVLRTAIIYLFLLITLRLLGKRMGGQLTISELAVMLTLGAIISVPMQLPDKGLLQGVLVLICALGFQRGINYLTIKSKKIEYLTQGRESILIKDGVMVVAELSKMNISKEQMQAVLRNEGIFNLGEVCRVYIEACGLFSIFKYAEPRAGLSLIPPDDEAANQELTEELFSVCCRCGQPAPQRDFVKLTCNNCGTSEWTNAVKAILR